MRTHSSGNGVFVHFRGHLAWLVNVRMNLGEENMCRLRCSCFGHLFDLHQICNQGQLYAILLRKLDSDSHRQMRLTFHIGGQTAHFGPEEFAAITGLKFAGPGKHPLPSQSNLHADVFNKKKNITFFEFEAKFNEVCKKDAESDTSFKLALLYVVYGVLLIKERTAKRIDLRYMHLADDIDAFLAHPWGVVAYEFLVNETHKTKKKYMDRVAQSSGRSSVNAHGFNTVLQCWAYDIFPKLASSCAVNVVPDRIPRILRWSVEHAIHAYDALNSFFTPSNVELVPFVFTEDEKVKLKVLDVHDYVVALVPPPSILAPKLRKRKLSFNQQSNDTSIIPLDLCRSTRLARDTSPATSNVASTPGDAVTAPCKIDVAAAISELARTTKDVAAAVIKLSSRCDQLEAASKNDNLLAILTRIEGQVAKISDMQPSGSGVQTTPTQSSFTVEVCNTETTPVVKILRPPPELESFKCTAVECVKKVSEKPTECEKKVLNRKSARGRRKTTSLPKPFVPRLTRSTASAVTALITSPKSVVSVVASIRSMYDPLEADYESKAIANQFYLWFTAAKKTNSEEMITLPSRLLRHVRYNWFESIWSPRGWLASDHIDALINLLLYKKTQSPEQFVDGWSCLEHFAWLKLCEATFEDNAHVLMPYLNGDMPPHGGLPWHDASVVYAIANIDNNHWVMVQISLENQSLIIYNSISSSINWDNIPPGLINAARFLPWLCKEKGVWERRNTSVELKSEWDIVPYPNPPQQTNCSDCGIMALKYIECLVSGHDVADLDPERCVIFRRSYCGQLYEYGQKFLDSQSS